MRIEWIERWWVSVGKVKDILACFRHKNSEKVVLEFGDHYFSWNLKVPEMKMSMYKAYIGKRISNQGLEIHINLLYHLELNN